jgi:hypothetical protein
MTQQQEADNLLSLWQLQARIGIRPERRLLPKLKSDDQFSRDLEIIRQVMERA